MTTAIGKARAVGRRLQAVDSRLSDLQLRSGKGLVVEMGAALTPTAQLSRTIQGASSIKLSAYDPELKLLRAPLLSQRFEAEIDGLRWRYLGTRKSGLNLTMTLEDRWVSVLRERKGPKKVRANRGKPDEVTRAEFIMSLVEEAAPGLERICPELHVQQPVESEAQASRATEDAKDRRERGLGDVRHLTMDGAPVGKSELELAELALQIAARGNAPFICMVAVIEALMAESGLGKASPGNVLQALGPGGAPIGPAADEISGFLFGKPTWTGVTAVGYHRAHPDAPAHEIAQAVQKSAFSDGSNYAKFEAEAREFAEAFDGAGAGEAGSGKPKVREWEVEKDEGYWEAIQRLAKEVNWRAFIVGNRFYFIDEYELARGIVRLAISANDEPGDPNYIPPANVDFDYNHNKPVTEVTIKVPVKQWKPPPGSVVTLEGYGPASKGFGDAPAKPGQKRRIGLSGNRNVATGEGRARYIVVSIEVPLTEVSENREATIKLRKPTAPLPEPANESRSAGGSVGARAASGGAEKMISWAKSTLGTNEGSARHSKWAAAAGVSTGAPWCSVWISYGLTEICGLPVPTNPAYSGTWLDGWSGGTKVPNGDIEPGDILVFDWGDGGITDHVALAIGDGRLIGGNQSNSVTEDSINTGALVGVVRPDYPDG